MLKKCKEYTGAMILGLSLSHDASAAITENDGVVHSALGEERITRLKNHSGLPVRSIERLIQGASNGLNFEKVVIGSHQNMSLIDAKKMIAQLDQNPSNPEGKDFPLRPAYKLPKSLENLGPRAIIEKTLTDLLLSQGAKVGEFVWENHHNSHLGCALGATEAMHSILVSFDGHGDGESAALALSKDREIKRRLISIPQLDSLGTLYSAVTAKYNFKPNQHEGKITGLAAFGSHSRAVEYLMDYVSVSEGKITINYFKSKTMSNIIGGIRSLGFKTSLVKSLEDIVYLAESQTENYADLAFAIQSVLESSIVEIASHWIDKTGVRNLSLAGGVFANVKLNQKLADLSMTNKVTVFPNMGDGGIALGGVWSYLSKSFALSSSELYTDMFLGPVVEEQVDSGQLDLNVEEFQSSEIANLAAVDIEKGKLVAIHQNRMEFGPRALGNRSLLLDPRDRSIQITANNRLHRTEFMPFAPMVLEREFDNFFETKNQTRTPFNYMTMTCNIKEDKRHLIPAVTHVDGTARPQIINSNLNPLCNSIIESFYNKTRIPILVNTSLNVHEEPINFSLDDSISCLRRKIIDVIYTDKLRILLK
jgi:carbamoyltransferase